MSASKRQGIIAIGVGCILVSVLLVFYGISQPKVNETPLSQLQDTLSQTSIKTSSSDKNDASFKNSVSIDGRGDTKAQAILEYRDYLGGYTNVSQLKEIKGIGDSTFAKIEPYVTV